MPVTVHCILFSLFVLCITVLQCKCPSGPFAFIKYVMDPSARCTMQKQWCQTAEQTKGWKHCSAAVDKNKAGVMHQSLPRTVPMPLPTIQYPQAWILGRAKVCRSVIILARVTRGNLPQYKFAARKCRHCECRTVASKVHLSSGYV